VPSVLQQGLTPRQAIKLKKPKNMTIERNPKTLHYFIVADASGSMADQIDEVRMELNRHFDVLKQTSEETGDTIKVSLLTFDSELTWEFSGLDSHNLPRLTQERYYPRGTTALLDAAGQAIERAAYVVGDIDSESESVWVMIFSDGGENASRKFTVRSLSGLLEKYQTLPGWSITFTGCDLQGILNMKESQLRDDRTRSYMHNEKAKAIRDLNKTMTMFSLSKFKNLDFDKPEDH
jgi:hypothetical protein